MRRAGEGDTSVLPGGGKEEQAVFYGFNDLTPLEAAGKKYKVSYSPWVLAHSGRRPA